MAWFVLCLHHEQGSSHPVRFAARIGCQFQNLIATIYLTPYLSHLATLCVKWGYCFTLEVCWSVQLPYLLLDLKEHRERSTLVSSYYSPDFRCQLASLYSALFLPLPIHGPGQIPFPLYIANLLQSHLSVNSYIHTDFFPSVSKCVHFSLILKTIIHEL